MILSSGYPLLPCKVLRHSSSFLITELNNGNKQFCTLNAYPKNAYTCKCS